VIAHSNIGVYLYNGGVCNLTRNSLHNLTMGFIFERVSGPIVTWNTIHDCSSWGVNVIESEGIIFHHNNLIRCNYDPASSTYRGPQALDNSFSDFDDGSEGNYWDDYLTRYPNAKPKGIVWSIPYVTGGNGFAQDRYPLRLVADRTPPVADAGGNHTIPMETWFTLDGSDSWDDLGISLYKWTFIDNGTDVELLGVKADHYFSIPGKFVIKLEVWDFWGNNDTDYAFITVVDTKSPRADAGPDIEIIPGEVFVLDGSGSEDNVGIVAFVWRIDEEDYQLLHEGRVVSGFILVPGFYEAMLTVADAAGNTDSDTAIVHVLDIESPIADAGLDQVVDQGTEVTFDGSGSSDDVGISQWSWTFRYSGQDWQLDGILSQFIFYIPGVYRVSLTVWDAEGNEARDDVVIRVLDTESPIADCGPDMTVGQGLVVLDGSRSTDNVGIVDFQWSIETKKGTVALRGESVEHLFDTVGEFEVSMQVTDAAGNWNEDSMIITVLDTTPPVADAGGNRTADQGTMIILDGIASSDNIGIVRYVWTIDDGEEHGEYEGMTIEHHFQRAGEYEVSLSVWDAADLSGQDVIVVTVLDIEPPIAMAGEDREVVQGTMVHLDGTMSTDNTVIVRHSWIVTGGASEVTYEGALVDIPTDTPGSFNVTLEVLDGGGNVGRDHLVLVVLPMVITWRLGPFVERDGPPVPDTDVFMIANGTTYSSRTDKDGWISIDINRYDLVSPLEVHASKDGWKPLDFEMRLDAYGKPMDPVPPMERIGWFEVGTNGLWVLFAIILCVISLAVLWNRIKKNN
jgi:hypothetical protein